MKPRDAEPLTPLRCVRGSVSILGFLSGASDLCDPFELFGIHADTEFGFILALPLQLSDNPFTYPLCPPRQANDPSGFPPVLP